MDRNVNRTVDDRRNMLRNIQSKLKKYSYILSQQPYTLLEMLFQKPDSVKNNDESNELIFYGGNEAMSIHSETQVVDFRGELPEKKKC